MNELLTTLSNLNIKKYTWIALGLSLVVFILTGIGVYHHEDISVYYFLLSIISNLYLLIFVGKAVCSKQNIILGGLVIGLAINLYIGIKVLSTVNDCALLFGNGVYTSMELMEYLLEQYSTLSIVSLLFLTVSFILLLFNCKKEFKVATGLFIAANVICVLLSGTSIAMLVLYIAVLFSKSEPNMTVGNANNNQPEKVSQSPKVSQPISNSFKGDNKLMIILLSAVAIIGIIIIIMLAKGGNKMKGASSNVSVDTTENDISYVDTDDDYYYDSDDELVSEDDDHSAESIKSWVEDTYGSYSFLSSSFQQALSKQEQVQESGYLCGPDWNYWWWSQDPSGSLEVLDVDDITNESCTAYVVADGNRLYVMLTYYNGSWHYDNFIGADDNCNYYDMIIEDL